MNIVVEGGAVTEAIGDVCNKCLPVSQSFPLPLDELAEKQDDDDYAPKVNESRARASGDLAAINEKEGVDKRDRLRFEGGRSVILLNASELAKQANRETVMGYQLCP